MHTSDKKLKSLMTLCKSNSGTSFYYLRRTSLSISQIQKILIDMPPYALANPLMIQKNQPKRYSVPLSWQGLLWCSGLSTDCQGLHKVSMDETLIVRHHHTYCNMKHTSLCRCYTCCTTIVVVWMGFVEKAASIKLGLECGTWVICKR